MSTRILIRTFVNNSLTELDAKVNTWVFDAGVRLLDVKVTSMFHTGKEQFAYTVLYEPLAERVVHSPKKMCHVPTVPAFVDYGGKERSAECMAGVFGVPEGWKFSPADGEPAPVVCLSPDCNLESYVELFGNVEEIS